MWSILVLFVSASLFSAVKSWPSQVPPRACPTLRPLHPGEGGKLYQPQNVTFPYRLQVQPPKRHNSVSTVKVSITGDGANPIQGFQIQARDVTTNKIVGQFRGENENNIQYINCSGTKDTASHTNKENKQTASAIWQSNNYKGKVKFHVTVAKSYDVFWVDLVSDEVEIA